PHLIASDGEVVGEAATPEILEAWTAAFYELANIMITVEKELYDANTAKPGGWNGWRNFVIKKIVEESAEIKSFYLYPEDGKEIADFHSGQFISVQVFVDELNLLQPRQYSLSSAFNPEYYTISVDGETERNSSRGRQDANTLHSNGEA